MAIACCGMEGGEGWSPGPCRGGWVKAGDASCQLAEKHELSYPKDREVWVGEQASSWPSEGE